MAPEVVVHIIGHAVTWVGRPLLRIPEMMRHKLQEKRLGRRPGQRGSGRCHSPGFEVGEIGCQRSERIIAHAAFDEVLEGFDILVGQNLGELVAALHRQHGGDGVEFFRTALDGGQGCLGFGHGRSKIAVFGGLAAVL